MGIRTRGACLPLPQLNVGAVIICPGEPQKIALTLTSPKGEHQGKV